MVVEESEYSLALPFMETTQEDWLLMSLGSFLSPTCSTYSSSQNLLRSLRYLCLTPVSHNQRSLAKA
ncbi:hypothetical protein CMV_009804 [Castanea mollissima]|uniref:Uncharacterized protein n=1 Tax=Castanea mollissima TaxID=60419 RepID=A0A8J4VQI7_9ROSI|nr:hypothetical protein CMV_009804 [Castanea mollissima]